MFGGPGDDILEGGYGRDDLHPGDGNDIVDGSGEVDTVLYGNAPGPMTVNLATGAATGWGTDQIFDVEWVATGPYDDLITGDSTYNKLRGRAGNDLILGGGGGDLINGGADVDECRQGATYLNCEIIR